MSSLTVEPQVLVAEERFRRMLAWSAGAHLVLLIVFVLQPRLYRPAPQAPVFVDLVAAVPAPPAPALAPRQVIDEPIVIPERPRARPKPKPAPKPEPEPAPKEPALTPEQILAQLRASHGSPADLAEQTRVLEEGAPGRVDPLLADYYRQVKDHVYRNWAGAAAWSMQLGLQVLYEIELEASGALRRVRLLQGSGDAGLDASAERAIHKAAPFPAPPGALRVLRLRFDPRELR